MRAITNFPILVKNFWRNKIDKRTDAEMDRNGPKFIGPF